jgi:hypothetical protein
LPLNAYSAQELQTQFAPVEKMLLEGWPHLRPTTWHRTEKLPFLVVNALVDVTYSELIAAAPFLNTAAHRALFDKMNAARDAYAAAKNKVN